MNATKVGDVQPVKPAFLTEPFGHEADDPGSWAAR